MRNLAKTISVRILTLQVVFVAIIAVAIVGLSRQSPLLECSALVATVLLVVADPLTIANKVGATATAKAVEAPAIERKIFNPNKVGQATSVPKPLFASKA
jgi:hypothetical protein